MVEGCLSKPPQRWPSHALDQLGKRESRWDQHVIRLVCLRPNQQMLDCTRREAHIDPARRRQKIYDETRLHRLWPSPSTCVRPPYRVTRQRINQGCADLLQVAHRPRRRRDAARQQIAAGAEMGRSVTPDDPDQ